MLLQKPVFILILKYSRQIDILNIKLLNKEFYDAVEKLIKYINNKSSENFAVFHNLDIYDLDKNNDYLCNDIYEYKFRDSNSYLEKCSLMSRLTYNEKK